MRRRAKSKSRNNKQIKQKAMRRKSISNPHSFYFFSKFFFAHHIIYTRNKRRNGEKLGQIKFGAKCFSFFFESAPPVRPSSKKSAVVTGLSQVTLEAVTPAFSNAFKITSVLIPSTPILPSLDGAAFLFPYRKHRVYTHF